MKLKAEQHLEMVGRQGGLCHTHLGSFLFFFSHISLDPAQITAPLQTLDTIFVSQSPFEAFVATSHFLISHLQATMAARPKPSKRVLAGDLEGLTEWKSGAAIPDLDWEI